MSVRWLMKEMWFGCLQWASTASVHCVQWNTKLTNVKINAKPVELQREESLNALTHITTAKSSDADALPDTQSAPVPADATDAK